MSEQEMNSYRFTSGQDFPAGGFTAYRYYQRWSLR